MLIPYQDLSQEALYSLAKEWVIANLSDTESQPDTEQWAKVALEKIKSGDLLIEFGEGTQSVQLIGKASEKLVGFPS
ncbi:MAG: YheU family protein [Enterobacterales bacterium]|nr:YheU family protein [Enterobacterales bacterium]